MLKKIVSLVVGATLVLATLGVSAATVATVSEYDATDSSKINVVTTVQNTGENAETYTYLAYKLSTSASVADLTNNEVVYVDEKSAGAGEAVTFSYKTAAANNEAVILVGGDAAEAGTPKTDEISANVYYAYTVAVGDAAAVSANLDVTGLDANAIVDIPANIGSAIVSGVKVNGEAVDFIATNNGVKVSLGDLADGAAIVIEVTTGAVETVVTVIDGAYVPAENAAAEDGLAYSSAFVLAKIEGNASEYGVKFGPAKDNFEVFTAKALGQGSDGLFAIRLYGFEEMDEEHKIDDGTFIWTKAYAIVAGETIYSDSFCRIRLDEVAE